uniref:Bestrophin homolog n=1 Tax=Steinernema glaseri TaxID=37863 RepID=A0A1I7YTP1_9BILA
MLARFIVLSFLFGLSSQAVRNHPFDTGREEDRDFVDNRVFEFLCYELAFVVLYSTLVQLLLYLWYADRFPFNLQIFPFNQLAYSRIQ